MALPSNGVYQIQTCMDTSFVMEIAGDVSSNRANVQIYTVNNGLSGTGNHQRFLLCDHTDGSKKLVTARDVAKTVEVYHAQTVSDFTTGTYRNVSQYDVNNSVAQKWYLRETKSHAGKTAYYIEHALNRNWVMDVSQAVAKLSQNINVWTKHSDAESATAYGDNQKWYFIRDAYVDTTMPVPSSIGLAEGRWTTNSSGVIVESKALTGSNVSSSLTTIYTNNKAKRYDVTFVCNAQQYQIRYRMRGRKAGSSAWSDWRPWRTLYDGQMYDQMLTDNGWGYQATNGSYRTVWQDNISPWMTTSLGSSTLTTLKNAWASKSRKVVYGLQNSMLMFLAQTSAQVNEYGETDYYESGGSRVAYDAKEYQIAIRSFLTDDYGILHNVPFVGKTTTQSVKVYWQPTISCTSYALTEEGINISYTSDFKRGGNTVSVGPISGTGGSVTKRTFTFGDVGYDGTITIPFGELLRVPPNAQSHTFKLTLKTCDGVSTSITVNKGLAYSSNHGLAIDATFAKKDGAIIAATPKENYPNKECHIIFTQDGETIISNCEYVGGAFQIIPPLNKDYTVMISGEDGTKWGVKSWSGIKVSAEGNLFNYGSTWFRLFLFEEPYANPNLSYDAQASSYIFMGDRRESVYFGDGAEVGGTVEGLCPINSGKAYTLPGAPYAYPAHCDLAYFHNLRKAKYAVYRDLYGRRYDIAITSTTEEPYDENLFKVSITFKERMTK